MISTTFMFILYLFNSIIFVSSVYETRAKKNMSSQRNGLHNGFCWRLHSWLLLRSMAITKSQTLANVDDKRKDTNERKMAVEFVVVFRVGFVACERKWKSHSFHVRLISDFTPHFRQIGFPASDCGRSVVGRQTCEPPPTEIAPDADCNQSWHINRFSGFFQCANAIELELHTLTHTQRDSYYCVCRWLCPNIVNAMNYRLLIE